MGYGGKSEYLRKLTSSMHFKSVELGQELDGSSPPSVFIGSWNYPKVYAGPMLVPYHGDTGIVDTPESWIPESLTQQDILDFRLSLVRGKQQVGISDIDCRLVEKIREISLADGSVESEARFKNRPSGMSLNEEHLPHGPSAVLDDFRVGNVRWDGSLEKVYYDGDLKAADAVSYLYEEDTPFSRIQKAFSVGAMGAKRKRRLVPTRWSITACDTALGNSLLGEVRHNPIVDCFKVHEFSSLNNYYAIILTPTAWQYEWMEAFMHVLGREEVLFSDYETNRGKRGYSRVGGCYYSCKFGVLEGLAREGRQAGAIVLREAYEGYVPLGVFNVRENVRSAMKQKPAEFASLRNALNYLSPRLHLPLSRFIRESTLLKEQLRGTQTTLLQHT